MGNPLRRPAVLLVLALCSVGAVVTVLGRLASGPKVEEKSAPLAGEPGVKAYPAFSPDGRRIAYSARGQAEKAVFHIFVRVVGSGANAGPRQLTSGEGNDVSPVWSPDGREIAFLRLDDGRSECLLISAEGGTERKVAEFRNPREDAQPAPAVAWARDGKALTVVDSSQAPPALVLVLVDGGLVKRITDPPAGSEGDSTPAISPDGGTLAFVRASNGEGGDIYLCGLDGGAPKRLTFDDSAIRGLAWTPDGRELIYAATRVGSGSELWRVPASGGGPRLLAVAGTHAGFPAISPGSRRLAYADNRSTTVIWRAPLDGHGAAGDSRELIRSTGRQSWPAWSPDGKRIVYISDQTGTDEIWACDTEGAKPVELTRFASWPRLAQPRWSPDGQTLLFTYNGSLGRGLFVLAPGHTQPALVALGGANGSWSGDGKMVYFDAEGRVWRARADGAGRREPLTSEMGTAQGVESADGKFVYFRHRRAVCRMPVEGGPEEEVFTPEYPFWNRLEPVATGVYYLGWEFGRGRGAVSFYDFAAKRSSVVLRVAGRDGNAPFSYSISPDGKYILYPQADRNQTNLTLVENFR